MNQRWPCRKFGTHRSCPLTNKATDLVGSRDSLKPRDVTFPTMAGYEIASVSFLAKR